MMRYTAIGILLLLWTLRPAAQTPALTTFDVVSVKELSQPVVSAPSFQPGGRFVMRGPLSVLLGQAYGRIYRFVNGPPWLTTDFYEIMAVSAREPTPDERTAMVKTLLADRFKLMAHVEDEDMLGYQLVQKVAGKLGPKLLKSDIDCAAYTEALKTKPRSELPKASNGERPCSADVIRGTTAAPDEFSILSGGMTMEQLARELTGSTQDSRLILDKTGLEGRYEVVLKYRREQIRAEPSVGSVLEIHDALEYDLGLKLQRATLRVPVMVVEHIERPSAN